MVTANNRIATSEMATTTMTAVLEGTSKTSAARAEVKVAAADGIERRETTKSLSTRSTGMERISEQTTRTLTKKTSRLQNSKMQARTAEKVQVNRVREAKTIIMRIVVTD